MPPRLKGIGSGRQGSRIIQQGRTWTLNRGRLGTGQNVVTIVGYPDVIAEGLCRFAADRANLYVHHVDRAAAAEAVRLQLAAGRG